ncbi:MAG: hypothetical protein IJ480_01170 [Clostridia bacterium]|nr:hypothetical protein [Clostridia bacterium]
MSGFIIKLIAAATMLIDHAGLLLFPGQAWMRIVGRISYPLFAYSIAEGFRYTRNRLRYFLQIFILGVLCQIVYTIAERELYFGILLTFSFSIALMAAIRETKAAWQGEKTALGDWLSTRGVSDTLRCTLTAAALFLLTIGTSAVTMAVRVDYGFCGILVPLAAYLPEKVPVRKGVFAAGLLALSLVQWSMGDHVQIWCLFAMIPLLLYTGKPGKYRMKWFFYIFYPAHMAALYLLSLLF